MSSITPCLWFDGHAERAARFYCSLFADSRVLTPENPTPDGTPEPVMVEFEIDGQRLQGLNGGPQYKHSPAFSLSVSVPDQAEVDRLWNALIADGGKESMCGWCEDRFGISWQIVPERLVALLNDPDREAAGRATQAMYKMRKIVVADIEAAFAETPA